MTLALRLGGDAMHSVVYATREEADRLASILEHMSDAFLALDREWRFTYINDRAERSLGMSRKDVLGRYAFDVFPQFAGTEWEMQSRKAMDQREPVTFDEYYPPARAWTEVRAYPTDEGIALFYRDVTDRKNDEITLRRQVWVIDGINSILNAALTAPDETALGLTCLSVLEQVSGSAFGFISQVGGDGLLHDVAVSNPGWVQCEVLADEHQRLRPPMPIAGLHGIAVKTGRSFYTNRPEEHPERVGLPQGHPALHGFLGVPLKLGGRSLGLVGLANREGGYDDEVVDVVERVAPSIAEAFERMRAEKRQQRAAQFDRALADVSAAAHSSLDDREILERAVVEVARASGLNAVAVHLRHEGQWSFPYSHGLPKALREARLADEQAPMSVRICDTLEPLVMSDALTDPRANRPLVDRFDIRSLVGLPLVVRGKAFGVLFAGSIGETVRFGDQEVEFLGRVASALSLALENARLYAGQHRIAETLQQALLALPERVEGVSFAHAYRSASEATLVGGDFYDIFEIDNNAIGVVVGDVAGKGLEAAALTALLKNTIRAHAADGLHSPETVVRLTSQLVYQVTSSETFATVFLGFIDVATRTLSYCNAGHTTTLVAGRGGQMRLLAANSPLVGAFADAGFSQDSITLQPDDLLVVYTDGVIEARSGGSLFGEERLLSVASKSSTGEPSAAVRDIIDDVLTFTGGTLSDDVAIIALRLLPAGVQPAQLKVEV